MQNATHCIHVDMGGEKFYSWARLHQFCGDKKNILFISHFDQDHISLIPKVASRVRNICYAPLRVPPKGKQYYFKNISTCKKEEKLPTPLKIIYRPLPSTHSKENALSNVFLLADHILIPGDSLKKQERNWSQFPPIANTQILVLGHHGSATSTSQKLLNHLPHLQVAISSARKRKYGHPHREILYRLQNKKVPVLTTETFGNLIFELRP